MMRIVIDMQGAQSESRFRGIGRLSLSLSLAIARQRADDEVILALNGLFAESIEPIRAAFDGLIPQANIRVWDCPGPTRECQPENGRRREVAESIREAFIAAQQPDAVVITSLFEGFGDDAVTSIGSFDKSTPTAVVLYDLIPLINPDENFRTNALLKNYYQRKIDSLRNAKLLLAISDSARQEACGALKWDEQEVVNVSAAFDTAFQPIDLTEDERRQVLQRHGISRRFVMYTGGADERKNLHRLIQAYAGLPADLRRTVQLVFVGRMPDEYVRAFGQSARDHGMGADELVCTGYVGDEDLRKLYGCCELFVFPSTHEGFGIPPLEAMACGAPVIGSGATSLTEVIGLPEALFDPHSVDAIRALIERALTDEAFRQRLVEHGLEHSKTFTWDKSAVRVLDALRRFDRPEVDQGSHQVNVEKTSLFAPTTQRILLIKLDHLGDFILAIPAITRLRARYPFAQIDVVLGSWAAPIARSLDIFNRIYEFDFFKKKSSESAAATKRDTTALLAQLAPGYDVAIDLRRQSDTRFLLARVDARLRVGYETFDPAIDEALHIALPSHMDSIYESTPLNETPISVQMMRLVDALPANPNDFVSFPALCRVDSATAATASSSGTGTGIALFPRAGNEVKEWARDKFTELIRLLLNNPDVGAVNVYFANDREAQDYGLVEHDRLHIHAGLDFESLTRSLGQNAICIGNNSFGVHIGSYLGLAVIAIYGGHETVSEWAPVFNTGYVISHPVPCSPCHIHRRSDCPYDLRCLEQISVGAVHASVLDALSSLVRNPAPGLSGARITLAENKGTATLSMDLIRALADLGLGSLGAGDRLSIARAIAVNHQARGRNLYVDISELVQRDAKSGIQRVVRSVLRFMLDNHPPGYSVVPVYATADRLGYRKATRFTQEFLGSTGQTHFVDEPVLYAPGDIYLGLDLHPQVVRAQRSVFQHMRSRGVSVQFVVFDMLTVTMPQHFVPGSGEAFTEWLYIVAENDGAICISATVADELRGWMEQNRAPGARCFAIDHFHLGADIKGSLPTQGISEAEQQVLNRVAGKDTFLMVGTLEPRKGHGLALSAFEALWAAGVEANLVIVGKKGWLVDKLVSRLEGHPQAGKRLFWVSGASDEFLERVYQSSCCLLVPSEGEGFCLPLIEAAHHRLPILARDLPVFREVAGEHASYFSGTEPDQLADAIRNWLDMRRGDRHPRSEAIPVLTWAESAAQLMTASTGQASR